MFSSPTQQYRQAKKGRENRIKSFLLFIGTNIPEEFDNPNWSKAFLFWLSEQYQHNEIGKLTIQWGQRHILGERTTIYL